MENKLKEAIVNGFQQKYDEWIEVDKIIDENNYKSIMEIGNYDGDSLIYFAQKFNKVFGLDISKARKELPDNVTQIVGDSKSKTVIEEVYSTIIKGRRKGIDVLFIDGDHSYKGVKADFENYKGLVKKGGIIVFHDILDTPFHRSANCFVSKLWNEIKNDYETLEFISEPLHWAGIGIIKL